MSSSTTFDLGANASVTLSATNPEQSAASWQSIAESLPSAPQPRASAATIPDLQRITKALDAARNEHAALKLPQATQLNPRAMVAAAQAQASLLPSNHQGMTGTPMGVEGNAAIAERATAVTFSGIHLYSSPAPRHATRNRQQQQQQQELAAGGQHANSVGQGPQPGLRKAQHGELLKQLQAVTFPKQPLVAELAPGGMVMGVSQQADRYTYPLSGLNHTFMSAKCQLAAFPAAIMITRMLQSQPVIAMPGLDDKAQPQPAMQPRVTVGQNLRRAAGGELARARVRVQLDGVRLATLADTAERLSLGITLFSYLVAHGVAVRDVGGLQKWETLSNADMIVALSAAMQDPIMRLLEISSVTADKSGKRGSGDIMEVQFTTPEAAQTFQRMGGISLTACKGMDQLLNSPLSCLRMLWECGKVASLTITPVTPASLASACEHALLAGAGSTLPFSTSTSRSLVLSVVRMGYVGKSLMQQFAKKTVGKAEIRLTTQAGRVISFPEDPEELATAVASMPDSTSRTLCMSSSGGLLSTDQPLPRDGVMVASDCMSSALIMTGQAMAKAAEKEHPANSAFVSAVRQLAKAQKWPGQEGAREGTLPDLKHLQHRGTHTKQRPVEPMTAGGTEVGLSTAACSVTGASPLVAGADALHTAALVVHSLAGRPAAEVAAIANNKQPPPSSAEETKKASTFRECAQAWPAAKEGTAAADQAFGAARVLVAAIKSLPAQPPLAVAADEAQIGSPAAAARVATFDAMFEENMSESEEEEEEEDQAAQAAAAREKAATAAQAIQAAGGGGAPPGGVPGGELPSSSTVRMDTDPLAHPGTKRTPSPADPGRAAKGFKMHHNEMYGPQGEGGDTPATK